MPTLAAHLHQQAVPTFCCPTPPQLLRAHPAVAMGGASGLGELVAAAERAMRGGLRLDATSAELWASLGTVAAEVGVRARRVRHGGEHC